MRVFSAAAAERRDLVEHFRRHGWVAVDALPPEDAARLPRWADAVAALADGECLQHSELTDTGPVLCRSEDFVPVHDDLRRVLTRGAVPEIAGALMGEPAVLYKEKINYKAPGGAGYSPHQDAPAYPMIDRHVSALIAIDDADAGNGCLEVVSGRHHELLPVDERGCIAADVAASLRWEPAPVRSGSTLWFHSRTPHRSGGNTSDRPRRAIYPTYNAASEGDLRARYYAVKRAAFARATASDRALVSLIGDFEGRPA